MSEWKDQWRPLNNNLELACRHETDQNDAALRDWCRKNPAVLNRLHQVVLLLLDEKDEAARDWTFKEFRGGALTMLLEFASLSMQRLTLELLDESKED